MSVPKALFLDSIRWCVKFNVPNVFYWRRTYFVHISTTSDINLEKHVFLYDLLIYIYSFVYYRTYVFVASHPRDNSLSRFIFIQFGSSLCKRYHFCFEWAQLDIIIYGVWSCLFCHKVIQLILLFLLFFFSISLWWVVHQWN